MAEKIIVMLDTQYLIANGILKYIYFCVKIRRRRWEDSIKMDLREIGLDGVNWIQLGQDRIQ